MKFKDFDELINSINISLGEFCNTFVYKRKDLSKKERSAKRGSLFVYDTKSNRNWAINEGGGTEIQYHILLNLKTLQLNYGLGFNTQYVPHANELPSIEYMRPFMNAYLNKETSIHAILPNYHFVYGSKEMLLKPQENEYVLFGRTQIIEERDEDYYFIEEEVYSEILQDLQKQFEAYIIIWQEKNNLKIMSSNIEKNKVLLEYKKQIILQGPPGTGKTKTAKDLAVKILGLEKINDLKNNEQFKLIQFHPSYTYEDFVRGIVSVPNESGKGVLFKTENKIIADFAKIANDNYLLSQDDNIDALQEKWLKDNFKAFEAEIEGENIILSGHISVFKVENDCFRYGKDWDNPSRINFKDFKAIIKAQINGELNIKENLIPKDISLHAHYRATYYLALLRLFFLKHKYTILNDKITAKKYVLIIDEINRANLPSVLGELIYALEYRNEAVESMYEYEGNREIILPSNLYIIGTMNTADRSVGHIDYAIKRRFAFIDVLPTDQAIDDVVKNLDLNAKAKDLYHKVAELFNEDESKTVYLQSDFKAKDVQVGHSYFLVENENQLKLRLEFEIKPLLNEYVKDGILSESALLEIDRL